LAHQAVIVVAEALSFVAILLHLGILVWFHERYAGATIWPVMTALGLVILSGLGASAIAGGAPAPGLWLAYQGAVLAGGAKLYLNRRHDVGPQ
jgi:hypothetical protein